MIKIEKNIPIRRMARTGRGKVYPFADMVVGDSFEFTPEKLPSVRSLAILRGKQMKAKFPIRKTGETYRCWRTA